MDKQFIAHIREGDRDTQPLEVHLCEVSSLACEFAQKIGVPDAGKAIGLLHDFGKFSKQFQNYLNSAQGRIQPDEDQYVDAKIEKCDLDMLVNLLMAVGYEIDIQIIKKRSQIRIMEDSKWLYIKDYKTISTTTFILILLIGTTTVIPRAYIDIYTGGIQ